MHCGKLGQVEDLGVDDNPLQLSLHAICIEMKCGTYKITLPLVLADLLHGELLVAHSCLRVCTVWMITMD